MAQLQVAYHQGNGVSLHCIYDVVVLLLHSWIYCQETYWRLRCDEKLSLKKLLKIIKICEKFHPKSKNTFGIPQEIFITRAKVYLKAFDKFLILWQAFQHHGLRDSSNEYERKVFTEVYSIKR